MYHDLSQKTLTLTPLPSHDVHSLLRLKDDVLSTLVTQNDGPSPPLSETTRNLITKENTLCVLFLAINLKEAQRVEECV